MPKFDTSFNFGANKKSKKPRTSKAGKKPRKPSGIRYGKDGRAYGS